MQASHVHVFLICHSVRRAKQILNRETYRLNIYKAKFGETADRTLLVPLPLATVFLDGLDPVP